MSSSETSIFNYYRDLNAYLHGIGNDPGTFRMPKPCLQATPHVVTVNPEIPETYQWLYKGLERLVAQKRSLVQNIIVQGSYGDFTNNNYSDLDIILYIEQSAIENQQKRLLLRKFIQKKIMAYIYSIDPLQHHGVFLLWPELCDCYAQSILPLVVYSKAWSVYKFEAGFRCTAQDASPRTPDLIQTIMNESSNLAGWVNFYRVKRLSSHIMMVPCLYYADQGNYLHKASSFEPFILEFPQTRQLLADVAEIRNRWPQKPWFVRLLQHVGPHLLGRRYPFVCGFLYRSRRIQRRVNQINLKTLSESVTLKKNAIL